MTRLTVPAMAAVTLGVLLLQSFVGFLLLGLEKRRTSLCLITVEGMQRVLGRLCIFVSPRAMAACQLSCADSHTFSN